MKCIVRGQALAMTAVLLASAATASAAPITLGQWNFNDLVGADLAATNGPWTQSVSTPEATVSTMTDNSLDHLIADNTRNVPPVALASRGLLLGMGSTGIAVPDADFPEIPGAPVSSVDYMMFDLTANQDYLKLTSLSFKLGQHVRANQNASGTIDENRTYVQAFYSTDGTTFNPVGAQQEAILDISDGLDKFSGMDTYTVDLSSIAGLSNGQTVNFRLGITDNRGAGSQGMASYWDDFEIQGQVVPEPASLALLGLAVAGLIARRRHGR